MNLLVLSTLSCILDNVIPFLIEYVLRYVFMRKRYDIELWNELKELKDEMSKISIVDEFAKYAKLQRKCNKLENILNKNRNQRWTWLMKQQLSLIYGFRILNGILILLLLYIYKREPVIILSEGLLWPIQKFLSWPCQHDNAISLLTWLIIVRLGISACKKLHI